MMNLKYYLRGLGVGIVVTALIMGIAGGGKKQTLTDDEIRERARELGMVEESSVLSDTVAGQSAKAAGTPEASPSVTAQKTAEPSPEKTPEPQATPEASPAVTAKKTAEPSPEKTPVSKENAPAPSAGKAAEQEPLTAEAESTPKGGGTQSVPPDSEAENTQTAASGQTPEETPAVPVENTPAAEGTASRPGSIQVNSGEGSYTVSVKLQEAGLVSSASEFDRYLYENGYDKKIRTGVFEIPAGADAETIAKIITRTE